MKKLLLISMLLLCTAVAFAQTGSVKGNQFELEGKIIQKITSPPYCGTIAWGMVVEFEIIKFSDASYNATSVAVIFTCPEFYGKDFFQAGRTHKVIVSDENQADFGWTIPNESVLAKYPLTKRLWVITAEKLNE